MKGTFLKGQPVRISPQAPRRRGELGIVVRYEFGRVVVLFLDGIEVSLQPEVLKTSYAEVR